MRIALGLSVLIALLVVSGCTDDWSPESSPYTAAFLEIPDASFDFGFANQNTTVAHTFWLHSTGQRTLHIERIVPG